MLAADDRALILRVPLGRTWQASQRAHLRMQLYITGETHRILGEFAQRISAEILDAADRDGKLNALGLYRAQGEIERGWGEVFAEWKSLFNNARQETAAAPFAVLVAYHQKMVMPALRETLEREGREIGESARKDAKARESVLLLEASPDPAEVNFVFEPQLKAVMDAADQRIYSDGLRLSQRLWKLDQESRKGMNAVLYSGVSQSKSAWDIAKDMEQYLGAGADCPRWTSTRLYKLTKTQIAQGDTRGLLRGDECDGRGMSYNALRMARTEIAAMHAIATHNQIAKMPWIEKAQIILSKSHPVKDICDEVIARGENGEGIYPKDKVKLPPYHPHCLCDEVAVHPDSSDRFAKNMRAWMRGEDTSSSFARGMDQYAAMLRDAAQAAKAVSALAAATKSIHIMGYSFNTQALPSVSAARALGESEEGWAKHQPVFDAMLEKHDLAGSAEETIGLWDTPEPSFNARLTGKRENVMRLGDEWKEMYKQDSVALLLPNPQGAGGILSWKFNRQLADVELDQLLGEMMKANQRLQQSNPELHLGLTVKRDGRTVEYWFSDRAERKSVQRLLGKAMGKAKLGKSKVIVEGGYDREFR